MNPSLINTFRVGVSIPDPALLHEVTGCLEAAGGLVFALRPGMNLVDEVQRQQLRVLVLTSETQEWARLAHDMPGDPVPTLIILKTTEELTETLAELATDFFMLPLKDSNIFQRRVQRLANAYETLLRLNTIAGRFESMYDQAPFIMHSLNRQGVLLRVNQRWQEVLGYSREEVEGKPYADLLHPEVKARITPILQDEFWEQGAVRGIQTRLRCKDGTYRDFIVDANIVRDAVEGAVSISTLHDVTEARQAEASARTNLERLQSILGSMQDSVSILDAEGRFIEIPSIGNPLIDLPMERYLGRTLHELIEDKSLADRLVQFIRDVLATGKARSTEYEANFGGVMRIFNVVGTRLSEDRVLAVAREMTEVRRQETVLRESDRLYRNLFDYTTDAIMIVQMTTGQFMEVNESTLRMLGYTRDEMLTLTIHDIEPATESLQDTVTTPIHTLRNDSPLFEQMFKRKDGSVVPVESQSRVIRYHDKPALIYFSRDITARRQALQRESERRKLAEALRDSAAAFNRTATEEEVYDTALAMVKGVVTTPVANITLIEGEYIALVRWVGYDAFGFSDEAMKSIRYPMRKSVHYKRVVATNLPLLIEDTHSEEYGWQHYKLATSEWVRSYIGAPIIIKGEIIGFLNVDSPVPGFFKERDIEPMQALANQMAIAIENVRLIQQLKDANASLETVVAERTEALVRANMSLRRLVNDVRKTEESLEQERSLLKMIIDSIPDMIYVKDRSGRYILLNEASVHAMGGQSMEELIGNTVYDRFDNEYARMHDAIDRGIIESGEKLLNMDNTMIYADGSTHRQLLSKLPLRDKQGNVIGIVGINRDITELKLIEQDLKREREQLAQVLVSARCLLWTANASIVNDEVQLELEIINETAAQELLPLDTSEKPYATAWQASILPEDAERRLYIMRTHLVFNRYHYNHEMRCLRRDGQMLWLAEDVEIKPVGDNQWRLVGICTDITERKRAEANLQAAYDELELRIQTRTAELVKANAALRQEVGERQRAEEAERRQRLLAEALTQSVATLNTAFDREAVFDYLLDTIEEIVPHRAANIMLVDENSMTGRVIRLRGYTHPDVEMKRVHDLTQYPDKLHILANNTHFIINDTEQYEAWARYPELAWIRSSLAVPISLDEGVIGFLNVESDQPNTFTLQHAEWLTAFANQVALAIRNGRLVEQIRNYAANLERAVQARTAQLRAVLGSIRDGLIYTDNRDEPLYLNRALVDMLGYTTEDWFGFRPQIVDLVVGDAELVERMMIRWRKQLENSGYAQEEVVMRRKDGTTFPAVLVWVNVKDDEMKTIGTLMLARDISQEKQLQEQRERFIANASHELRTPIANMKTRLYLLKRKPEKFEENFEIVVNVTNWMQRLVDDMFDLARFQRGIMELHRELVAVNALVREIMMFQQPEAERKEIALVLNAPEHDLEALIDPYRLMQVFSNLVGNAINYTPQGGQVGVDVYTETDDEGEHIVIAVADTGPGIAEEHLDNLFKPFYRATTDSRGAGLGLSIAYEIVALHGGTIEVESTVGMGSRFIVRIPLVKSATREFKAISPG
jgi:two-component system phosphate regulon sensor histidine kinase PhoR